MKFTKESAFEKLKGILTENGKKPLRMSEVSINRQLDNLMPILTSDDTELDEFIEKSKSSFEVMNSNAEFDNSQFAKSFEKGYKEKWEKEHPAPSEQTTTPPKESEVYDLLKKEMQQIKDELESAKSEKIINGKRSEIITKLKDKKVDDDKWISTYVKKLTISADTDIDSEIDDALVLYNQSASHVIEEVTPNGGGGTSPEDSHQNDDVKAILKRNRGIN